MEIKSLEKNKEIKKKLEATVNSALLTGISVSGTVFFGFSFLKSIRCEDYIGVIVTNGLMFLVFSAAGLIEGNTYKYNKEDLEKTLKLNK